MSQRDTFENTNDSPTPNPQGSRRRQDRRTSDGQREHAQRARRQNARQREANVQLAGRRLSRQAQSGTQTENRSGAQRRQARRTRASGDRNPGVRNAGARSASTRAVNRNSRSQQARRRQPRHGKAPSKLPIGPLAAVLLIAVVLIAGGFILSKTVFSPKQDSSEVAAQAKTADATQAADSSDEASDAASEDAPKEEAKEAAAEPVTIDVMMIGDILMHDPVIEGGLQADGSYNYDHLYEPIANYIDAADIRILNQETVMGYPENGFSMYYGNAGPIFNSPTELADAEMKYGFNVILKAANHTFDQGFSGLAHELNYWGANYPDVPVLGVANPEAEEGDDSQDWVHNVYMYEKDGFKVAILNHTFGTNENPDYELDYRYCSYLYEDKIRDDVQKARAQGADIIIACPHWGIEYETEPSNEEYTFSKLYTELGCELIIGGHPHILQRCETLRSEDGNKSVCFYSMGNYVAALMPASSLIGGIARATLVKDADGARVEAASFIPTCTVYSYGTSMTSWPIQDYTYDMAYENVRSDLTPDFAHYFVGSVFGENYDAQTGIYTHDMDAEGRLV